MPPSEGDIDRLLTEFFRAQQPNPWPTIAPPDSEAREIRPLLKMATPKRAGMPGRWALAASILILAVTSIWLAGLAPTPRTGPDVNLNITDADLRLKSSPVSGPAPPTKAEEKTGTPKDKKK